MTNRLAPVGRLDPTALQATQDRSLRRGNASLAALHVAMPVVERASMSLGRGEHIDAHVRSSSEKSLYATGVKYPRHKAGHNNQE